jgi:uncharacterized protein (DUF433 family)
MKAPAQHVRLDDEGRPWIDGTNVKVIEVALDRIAHGWSAEEIHLQHYGGLSLAQIHAALGYYYDNKAALDEEIKRQFDEVERLREEAGPSPFRSRLEAESGPK